MTKVMFAYKNHRGEISERVVDAVEIRFLENPGFGYEPGWFLIGKPEDRSELRQFRLDPDHMRPIPGVHTSQTVRFITG